MEEERPKSIEEELEALMARLGGVDQELRGMTLMMEKSVRVLTGFFSRRIDELTAQRNTLRDELAELASAHRAELLVGSKKIVRLRSGTIRWRKSPPKLEINENETEERVIRRIMRHRGAATIFIRRSKPTLDRVALAKRPDFVAKIRGIFFSSREDFIIKLAKTQAEIVLKGDPLVVRGEPTERED